MSEMPEDIRNSAGDCIDRMPDRHTAGAFWPLVEDEVARAILAERKRCAEIANRQVQANNTGSGFDSHVAYSTAWNIRDEIQFPAHSQALPTAERQTEDAQ